MSFSGATEKGKKQSKKRNGENRNYTSRGKGKYDSSPMATFSSTSPYTSPVSFSSTSFSKGSSVAFHDQKVCPPVFGPSVTPSMAQFIDLTTNMGFMSPFDMQESENLAATHGSSYLFSSTKASNNSFFAPSLSNHPSMVIPDGCTLLPGEPGPISHREVSPSPQPFPPDAKSGKVTDGFAAAPSESMFSPSSVGLSISKSTRASVESLLPKCTTTDSPKKLQDGSQFSKATGEMIKHSFDTILELSNHVNKKNETGENYREESLCESGKMMTKQVPIGSQPFFPPQSENSNKSQKNASQGIKFSVTVEGHCGQISKIQSEYTLAVGDHVLFEGDRGTDMGCVIGCEPIEMGSTTSNNRGKGSEAIHRVLGLPSEQEIYCWKHEQPQEAEKTLDECRALVEANQCQLEIVDAAFQFDKKKLTFYYRSPKSRVDFRSLLTPLYSIFHCRIWIERVPEANSEA